MKVTQEYVTVKRVMAWVQPSPAKVLICGHGCTPTNGLCNGYCTGKTDIPPPATVEEGYAVKSADGTITWQPKAEFESTHVALGHIGNLPPFHQRLLVEIAELRDRLTKLDAFLCTEFAAGLPAEERGRQRLQSVLMTQLLELLVEREAALQVPVA